MTKYLTRRLGQSLLTVFLTLSTVFVLVRLAPETPPPHTRRRAPQPPTWSASAPSSASTNR